MEVSVNRNRIKILEILDLADKVFQTAILYMFKYLKEHLNILKRKMEDMF